MSQFAKELEEIEARAILEAKRKRKEQKTSNTVKNATKKGKRTNKKDTNKEQNKYSNNKVKLGGRGQLETKIYKNGGKKGQMEGIMGNTQIISGDEGEGIQDLARFKGKRLEKVRRRPG
jgi:hypothetical protein